MLALEANVEAFNLAYFGMGDKRQGVVHIIGPEQGFTVPGATTVCGDSHTATHGAFGALAFGIGTSEVEGRRRSPPYLPVSRLWGRDIRGGGASRLKNAHSCHDGAMPYSRPAAGVITMSMSMSMSM